MADSVSADDLKKEISDILKDANLAQTSTKKVRQKLEKIFQVDLSTKKDLIDKLVMKYVDDNESDGSDDEEVEQTKPPKRAAAASKKNATKKKKTDDTDSDYKETEEDYTELVARAMSNAPKKGGKNNRVWLPKAAAGAVRAYKASVAVKKKKKESSDEEDSDSGPERKAKKGKKSSGKAKGKGSGYTRNYKLSPALSDLMGCDELPRHEVVKRIWAMIKEKNLYDPNNKRFAICDDGLYKVIGTKRFRAFGMMKYLKSHFLDD